MPNYPGVETPYSALHEEENIIVIIRGNKPYIQVYPIRFVKTLLWLTMKVMKRSSCHNSNKLLLLPIT